MRTIPWRFWTLFVAIVLASPPSSVAELRVTYLDQLFLDADVVVEVQIESASEQRVGGEECGVKYTGTILNSYKTGEYLTDPNTIQFGRHIGLEIGQKYLGFLRYQKDAESIYQELEKKPLLAEALARETKETTLDIIRCNEIVPGLVAEVTWIVSGPEVIVDPELLVEVPPGVRVDATDGITYYLRASDVSEYLFDLGKGN